MAYQPVYVEISDTNGKCGQSHSIRRKVEWVEGFLNTDIGKIGDFRLFVHREKVVGPKGGDKGEKTTESKLMLNVSDDAEITVKGRQVIITMNEDTKKKRKFVKDLGEEG